MTSSNSRIGSNHKRWFTQRAGICGTTPHFLSTTAELLHGAPPVIALKTMGRGGSSTQLSRGWADQMISQAAQAIADSLISPAPLAAERAFDVAARIMGLGRKNDRVGSGKIVTTPSTAGPRLSKFVACLELDACLDTKKIFIELARAALRGTHSASHLGLHASYGRENGYRGTHMLLNINDLMRADLQVESSFDERGASIHVFATIDGSRHNLVSFKRKGGDGPSERYADQMQVTLLTRGTLAAGAKIHSTISRRDTGRSVVDSITAPLLAGAHSFDDVLA